MLIIVALVLLCRAQATSWVAVIGSVRIWRLVCSIVVLVMQRLVRGCCLLVVVARVRICPLMFIIADRVIRLYMLYPFFFLLVEFSGVEDILTCFDSVISDREVEAALQVNVSLVLQISHSVSRRTHV